MPFTDKLLTARERFQAVMHYRPFDRGFLCDFQGWQETADVWHEYGAPKLDDAMTPEWGNFFGFDRYGDAIWCRPELYPKIEEKVLQDEGATVVKQLEDGSIVRAHKYAGSIPIHLDHLLKDRKSWEEHFKWRLDAGHPQRMPEDMEEVMRKHIQRDYPLGIYCGSTFGWLRNWMGLEGVSYIQYDDPELFADMIQTIGDCIVGTVRQTLALAKKVGLEIDSGFMWEDMSYAQGPLLGVPAFKEHLVPQYKRMSSLLRENGVDLLMLDSDGDVRLLLPHWLEGGVNILFPMEVGTWGMDPVEVRRQMGKDLRMMGGFDKHILASNKDAITREIERLAPLVEEGGFIAHCDHRVPPDVSLDNYLHYVDKSKEIWGRSLANVRPTGKPDPRAPRYGQPYDYREIMGDKAASH